MEEAKLHQKEIVKTDHVVDFVNGEYVSKSGDEYIDALSKLFSLKNKNDKPFTKQDIIKQPTLNAFNFDGKNDYKLICELRATPMIIKDNKRKNENIEAINFVSNEALETFNKALGVSYILTCCINNNEHIIKIGQTRTPFKARLQSYNCGSVYNWRTASTTNIKIKQSMVTTRLTFRLYLYDCSSDQYTITWHGVKSSPFASPKSLAVEDIMIKKFMEQFNQKPLANVQADATTVD